ncbi:hypothetical protein GCM10027075_43490 [Streptomyces heilongjiangensis]
MKDGRARKEAPRGYYAAEVLLELELVEDEPEDDFASDDDVEDVAFASEEDDDFDDAGLLLDDEPRLSLR